MKKKKAVVPTPHRDSINNEAEAFDESATGIVVRGMWLNECSYEDFGFNRFVGEGAQVEESEGEEMNVEPEAEVWFNGDHEAMVRLSVEIKPASQPSFRARVAYVAHYVGGENSIVPISEFAWGNGLAYLVPFVREKLAAITQASFYPVFYLQPINVSAFTDAAQSEEATDDN